MAINFKCPTCVANTETSTVDVLSIQKNFVVTKASFDTDGDLVKPVITQRVTTLCSNNHTVVTDFPKLPEEILQNMKYFTG